MKKAFYFSNQAGDDLLGVLTLPSGRIDDLLPAVLFCSGFKNSGGQVKFTELGDILAENGIASFAFDSTGTGYSFGKQGSITMTSMLKDATAAFDLLDRDMIDKNRICCIGHSLGALIALILTQRQGDKAKCAVLMSPAIDQKALISKWFNSYELGVLRAGKAIGTPKGLISSEYIKEAENTDWTKYLPLTQVPTLIFHGQADKDVPIDFVRTTQKAIGDKAKLIEISGADHKLESERAKQVLKKNILEWLKEHLKEGREEAIRMAKEPPPTWTL